MASLEITAVRKSFGDTEVLRGIDLSVNDGEFMVFVGPSGCGKSTLLRSIAGLEDVDSGDIFIDGKTVLHTEPSKRGIAMVFQSYALYPHMTVYDNMGFALKLAKCSKAEINEKVTRAASLLELGGLLDRKPSQLSGGQRQRVAIGRAIVREPKIFLLDEPLSNLDAELRVRMRFEFAKLHRSLGTTMIYVTHDQVEAMTLADRIAVISGGQVEQVGRPMDLYNQPATQFVAGFLGSPRMNMIGGTIAGRASGEPMFSPDTGSAFALPIKGDFKEESKATFGVRPEGMVLCHAGGIAAFTGRISHIEMIGNSIYAYLDVPISSTPLIMLWIDDDPPVLGAQVAITLDGKGSHLFDAQGKASSSQAS